MQYFNVRIKQNQSNRDKTMITLNFTYKDLDEREELSKIEKQIREYYKNKNVVSKDNGENLAITINTEISAGLAIQLFAKE